AIVDLRAERSAGVAARNRVDLLLLLAVAAGVGRTFASRSSTTRTIAQRGVEAAERRAVVRHDVGLAAARVAEEAAEAERVVHRLVNVVRARLHDDAVAVPGGLTAETHIAPVAADTRIRVARGPESGRRVGGRAALSDVVPGIEVDAGFHHHERPHAAAEAF